MSAPNPPPPPGPDTRSNGLSDRERELLNWISQTMTRSHGANVQIADPRVTALRDWILGIVGTGAVAAVIWMAQNLNTLTLTLTGAIATQNQHTQILQDHEQRLREEERLNRGRNEHS